MKATFNTQTKQLLILNAQDDSPRLEYYNAGTTETPDWQAGDYMRELTTTEIALIDTLTDGKGLFDSDTGLILKNISDPVPSVVTAAQLRAVLTDTQQGQVDDAISAITDTQQKQSAKAYWNHAIEFERNHPLLVSLAASLHTAHGGWSPADVDAIFVSAIRNSL